MVVVMASAVMAAFPLRRRRRLRGRRACRVGRFGRETPRRHFLGFAALHKFRKESSVDRVKAQVRNHADQRESIGPEIKNLISFSIQLFVGAQKSCPRLTW